MEQNKIRKYVLGCFVDNHFVITGMTWPEMPLGITKVMFISVPDLLGKCHLPSFNRIRFIQR